MPQPGEAGGIFNDTSVYEHEIVTEQDDFVRLGFDRLQVQHFYPWREPLEDIRAALEPPVKHGLAVQETLLSYQADAELQLDTWFERMLAGDSFDLAVTHQARQRMLGAVLIHHLDGQDTTLSGIFDVTEYDDALAEASFGFAKGFVQGLGRSVVALENNNLLEPSPRVVVVRRGH